MKSPDQGSALRVERNDSKLKLEEVYRILHTNAQMMCQRMGETLSFYSLFEE